MIDVARWEVALKGTAIHVTHSVNDGSYGGESFNVWDEASQSIKTFYFTTAGFRTA